LSLIKFPQKITEIRKPPQVNDSKSQINTKFHKIPEINFKYRRVKFLYSPATKSVMEFDRIMDGRGRSIHLKNSFREMAVAKFGANK